MKCQTAYCRRETESAGTKYCNVCRKRKSREADPVKYAFENLKNRAKQRGKPFTITIDWFHAFCYVTDYITGKGKKKESYSLDCIIAELGYIPGNLRVLTLSDNAAKGVKYLDYDYLTKTAYVVKFDGSRRALNYIDEDLPF